MSVAEALKAISKWRIDGVREDNPDAVFVSEDQLDSFTDAPPAFVIGKKGTGKTAFATKLAARHPQNIFYVPFAQLYDVYLEILRAQKHDDAPTREAAIQLAACLSAFRLWAKSTRRPLKLRKWERIYSRVQRPALLPSAAASLAGVFIKGTASPKGFDVSDVSVDLSHVRFHLNDARMLRKYTERLRRSIQRSKQSIYLFIDGIDELECFNRSPFDVSSSNLLRAFVQATHNWAAVREQPVKLIALVRPEFLDLAELPNIRERIEDNAFKLEWDEQSLFTMLTHRIQVEVDQFLERSKERGGYARRIGTRELFGRSESEHREVVTRLFNYSFLRPRDVVRYTKFVADYALKHDPHQPLPITYFDKVLEKQRRYLLNEMKAELALTLPCYQSFIQMLMHINATNEQKLFVPRDYFENEVEGVILGNNLDISARDVIARLYGAFAIGFRGTGNSRHFMYEEEGSTFSETNQVVLHNLFREVARDTLLIEFDLDEEDDANDGEGTGDEEAA